jgi:hypothetical protein
MKILTPSSSFARRLNLVPGTGAPLSSPAALPFARIGRAIDTAVGRGREALASSGITLPSVASPPTHPFADIGRAMDTTARHLGVCLPRVPIARADTAPPLLRRHGKDGAGLRSVC